MADFHIQTHNQKAVLGVALSFSILAVVAVSLRLIAHAIAHKRWTSSDYLIIAACIFAVGLQSISITGVFIAGIGYGHVAEIVLEYGLEPITKLSQLIIPLQFLWVLSLSCTKISILCLYLQIFPIQWVVWSSYATISIIVSWTIATILAGSLICRPFAFNWDKTILGGSCGDQVTSFTVTGIINLITDLMVLLLPMQPLYQLQMATYKKVTLVSVFGLGIFTCVISALRISVLSTMDFTDITFTIPKANIFSGIEPCLAVALASVPMMRPLLGRSAAKPYGSGQRPVNTESKSPGPKGVNDDGFERLDDDTSHLWLRPLGLQHRADASALRETINGDASEGDEESLDRHEVDGETNGGGIKVKQSFHVSERG
ncbi:hypothetical protein EJ02DRAFT_456042 [Clathrospora elynae]|uniref:Rhodopsin domain-containing protein n=1 Tax=Clathrospora elynae TaxID=706981 RepID=A0A6A5SJU4_9PLEO|nr:hypothetical protein EJ02DRAFT_456042 [Clathrospora elynae]